jgi:hypothetical protein
MEVLVLVCAAAVAAPDCQLDTAIHKFYVPGPQAGLAGCLREGMMYAAQSGLVGEDSYPKVVCVPPEAPRTRVSEREELPRVQEP